MIFIDDIERCRNTGGIDLLEAINQLLMQTDDGRAVSPVIVVVLGDIDLVALAAGNKYQETAKASAMVETEATPSASDKTNDAVALFQYGRRHLQKIVQLRFNIPSSEISVLQEMSRKLVRGATSQGAAKSREGGQDSGEQKRTGRWDLWRRQIAASQPATAILAHRSLKDLWSSSSWVMRILLIGKAPIFAVASVAADLAASKVGRPFPLHYDSRKMPLNVWHNFIFGYACSYLLVFLAIAIGLGVAIRISPPVSGLSSLGAKIWHNPALHVFIDPLGSGGAIDLGYLVITTILVAFLAILLLHKAFMSIYISEQRLIRDYANPRPTGESAKARDGDDELLQARAFLRRVRENAERLALINDSAYFGAAQKEIVKTLRPTPRLLKRTSNKVRLLMAILNERKLLRDLDSASTSALGVDAVTLGRWVVFEERWPDIARLAMTQQTLIAAIGAGDVARWEKAAALVKDATEINRFLGENEIPASDLTLLVTLRAPQTS